MTSPVIIRLQQQGSLSQAGAEAFLACRDRNRLVDAGHTLMQQGEPMRSVFCLESGWAIRHRSLANGRRQILNLLLPGDICDLQVAVDTPADHSVTTITPVMLSEFNPGRLADTIASHADFASALLWSAVQEEGILREHIVRIGRRAAKVRLAHLLLELVRRQALGGGHTDGRIEAPLTRELLADCLGLTPVHISRTLSALRKDGLVSLAGRGRLQIDDIAALARLADYDTRYLHLTQPDHALDTALSEAS
ncbi:MAG: Crp/Fnr family transcriptional regulator [Caulobacterales bacterium]|uniref:Crp/Fnr family transcriptional regulator n=1 Tax=Glycocaulis sp. TaxID=1969725 RepID=UPI003FA012FE